MTQPFRLPAHHIAAGKKEGNPPRNERHTQSHNERRDAQFRDDHSIQDSRNHRRNDARQTTEGDCQRLGRSLLNKSDNDQRGDHRGQAHDPSHGQVNSGGNDDKRLPQPHEQDRNDRHKNVLRISDREEIDIAATLDTYARRKENDQRRQEDPGPNPTEGKDELFLAIGSRRGGFPLASRSHGTHLTLAGRTRHGQCVVTGRLMALRLEQFCSVPPEITGRFQALKTLGITCQLDR